MINDEFLIKINEIIKYLKRNGGYDYKLYNHLCPEMGKPDSDIVEYAEDIRNFLKSLKYNDNLEKYITMEICKIIMDNLNVFIYDDFKLISLKEYCKSKIDEKIKPTPNEILMKFVNEALIDLLSAKDLYDFRNIE